MKYQFIGGKTDLTILVFVPDSSQTDGRGLTGLVFNTSGLVCYYIRPGSTPSALSLVTQTVTGAHSDGGFVEFDSTNMPGWYRLDVSDAIIAAGVFSAGLVIRGVTNMGPVNVEFQLESNVNTTQVSGTVQTANDNGADIDTILSRVTANVATEAKQDIIDSNVDDILLDTDELQGNQGNWLTADVSDIPTNAEFAARTILAASYALDSTVAKESTKFNPASDTVALVTDITTKTGFSLSAAGITAIWNNAVRTLTSYGTLISDMWSNATRTITGGTVTADNMRGTDSVPINPLLTNDARLDNLDASIAAIPTTPMRGTDGANTVVPDVAGTAATPAEVNEQMVDVMSVDVHAQPGKEALPATTSYNFILRLLYKFLRNKKDSTATLSQLYNDDGVTVDQESIHSGDGSLVTEEEWTVGS